MQICIFLILKGNTMKKMIIVGSLLLASTGLMAQQQTLFDDSLQSGGFGGPVVKFSQIHDAFAVMVGGRGGWIINKTITLGGGGYGLSNPVYLTGQENYRVHMGYGGFEIGFNMASDDLIHLSFHTLIGGGGFAVLEKHYEDWDDEHGVDDAFFVVEPNLAVTLNVTSNFRIEAGGSYRYINGVNDAELKNSDFEGFSAHIGFKFGKFN